MTTETTPTRTALILGATGGIGSALARQLKREGFALALLGRDATKVRTLAEQLDALPLVADATRVDGVETAFTEAAAKLGSLAAVANCVGSVYLKPAHLTSEQDWNQVITTNLTSAFATVRGAAKVMTEGGSVVLMSSVAATVGLSSHEAIAAAKAGIEGMMRSAAASYAPRQLRFNAVAPALVQTPATRSITDNARALETSRAMHPLGRIGQPEEIAAAIAFLLDPSNSWITGQVIGLDGGMSRVRSKG